MNKNIVIIGVLAIGLSIFGLFQVKYKVYNLKRDLYAINSQLDADKNAIRVLKAEWAYLNKPERIERLTAKYLKVSNITVSQVYRGAQVDGIYLASIGAATNSGVGSSQPTLKPILSSARGY